MPEAAAAAPASAILNPPGDPAAPAVPIDQMSPEQALARHRQIMSDPSMEEWRAAFARGDTDKREEFAALHRAIERLNPENLPATQEARTALEREKVIDHIRNTADLPENVAAMIRADTPVSAHERRLAEQERGRLLSDPEFVKNWLSGRRAERSRMALVDVILARPLIRS